MGNNDGNYDEKVERKARRKRQLEDAREVLKKLMAIPPEKRSRADKAGMRKLKARIERAERSMAHYY